MAYKLTWHLPGQALWLSLENGLSLDEMKHINQQMTELLDKSDRRLILLLDVSAFVVAHNTVDLMRDTQHYRNHPKLDSIVVVSSSKLSRLITLLAFHLSRARFIQVDSLEQAYQHTLIRKSLSPGAVN